MRHLAITLIILVASWVLPVTDAGLLDAGRAALDRGDLDQAIARLKKAATVNPNSAEAHYYLGLAYGRQAQKASIFFGMSEMQDAREEWMRAVELNPNSVEARL